MDDKQCTRIEFNDAISAYKSKQIIKKHTKKCPENPNQFSIPK